MKKLLIALPIIFLIGCLTTNQVYLPYNSPIFHKKNCVALRNNPSYIKYPSVQSAINSGVTACSICIKTNQYTSPSSYTQYPSYYSSQPTSNQNIWANPFGGSVSGAVPAQPTLRPSNSTPSPIYSTSRASGYNTNNQITNKLNSNSFQYKNNETLEELKYNPMNQNWSYAPKDSSPRYNPMHGNWQMSGEDDQLDYNPHNNTWMYAPKDATHKYNPMSNTWQTANPDDVLKYNPHNGQWDYVPENVETKYNPMMGNWEWSN